MVRVLCALLCLVGGEAGKAKVSVASGGGSKLPFGLSPVVDKDWDLLKGTVSVGGNYALADSAFTPKAVHVKAQRPGFKMKLSLLNPVSKRPKATATVTVGDLGDGDYVSVTLDSAEPTPRLLEVKRMTVPGTQVVLSPSWEPRVEGAEGLRLDVDAPLNGNRATLAATLRPKQRPSIKFHFGLDDTSTLNITPLLGKDGTSTKWEFEKAGLKHGVAAAAALLDKSLTLVAKVPVGGTLAPAVTFPIDCSAKPKFSIKQSFAF